MKQLFKVLLMIPCLVFLVNCSKSSKDSNNNNNNNNCNYAYNNGYNNGYNDPYYNGYNNNYNTNCNYGYNGNNGGYSNSQQRCQGLYWYQGQPVVCESSMACAGYQLQVNSTGPNAQTPGQPGRTVLCIP